MLFVLRYVSDPLSPSVGHIQPPVFRYGRLVTGAVSPDSGDGAKPANAIVRPTLGSRSQNLDQRRLADLP